MNQYIKIIDDVLNKVCSKGIQKAQCSLSIANKQELNIERNELTLFRTVYDSQINLMIIKDSKKGTISLNKFDEDSINNSIFQVIEIANSSKADNSYGFSNEPVNKKFKWGDDSANIELMSEKFNEFSDYVKTTYPLIMIDEGILDFTQNIQIYKNTNNVQFCFEKGIYNFGVGFLAKDNNKSSSFNGSGFSSINLNQPIYNYTTIDNQLNQSCKQITTKPIPEKFIGDLIVTPDCVNDILSFLINSISDGALISGTSIYKDKLNSQIANNKLTIHSRPLSDELDDKYFYTYDGFEVKDFTIVDKGCLKSFLLSLYGANKTGFKKSDNYGGCYIVERGESNLKDMIKDVKKGIIISRIAGGHPSDNGDFSAVAKNSFYINNGEIQYAISETMISANLSEILYSIKNISRETINWGGSIYPWIQFSDVTISS